MNQRFFLPIKKHKVRLVARSKGRENDTAKKEFSSSVR